jgi:cell migration-inducing and hyaluronan-binding protein
VVFPSDCSVPRPPGPDPQCDGNPNWYYNCANGACYGVPLYRQYLNPGETTLPIKMSSQGTGQRETMIPDQGLYYIDTTVPKSIQTKFGAPCPAFNQDCDVSVFESNKTYHVFLLFAKPATTETFELYVGPGFDTGTLQAETANLNTGAIAFTPLGGTGTLPSNWTTCYNSTNGILTVQMNMNFSAFVDDYNGSPKDYCQPSSMCSWNGSKCQCNITDPMNYLYKDCQADNSAICSWSVKDTDYPSTNGAYGFRFTLPSGFTKSLPPKPNPQPGLTGCFPQTIANPMPPPSTLPSPWNILFTPASSGLAGSCFYSSTPPAPAFCTTPPPPAICAK